MKAKIIVVCMSVLALGAPAFAEPQSWDKLLQDGERAIKIGDSSYAFYKLRKAWLAVPDKDFNAKPYTRIREALADAFALDKDSGLSQKEAARLRGDTVAMTEVDQLFKRREFNSTGDDYSVELRKDGALVFDARGLDSTEGEPVCGNVHVTRSQAEEMRKTAIRIRRQTKAKMPIIYLQSSPKYEELLSLCQPIKPGERKEKTGFDFSPFVPKNLPRTPDI